ncbi:MAG: nucleoporin-domain-containing protein [Monoraphidium minutum]|nr:MAG: nucleoporin-domain-containing protein [Monoraphidium minutum]
MQPPALWQRDADGAAAATAAGALPGNGGSGGGNGGGGGGVYDSDERIADSWRHVKHVAREGSKEHDLLDLLNNTRREETYSFPVPGWPSLLRPLSPAMAELPGMVQDKYRTCQTMCFCGVFPEIKRAWASVDNSLFLWRYDRSGDVPVEYCGEEQAICCATLAVPRAGVFLEAVKYVIVLATTVEIVLLGVCVGPATGGGGGDAFETLSLQAMPLYCVPSDNVVMTCAAASPSTGRIFLGGADGNLYELTYAATDSWRHKRCAKVRVTGGLQQLLPSFLPSLLFRAPEPLERLALDDERGVIYTLAANSAMQVFDLGAGGSDPARKVAEVPDFLEAACRAAQGGQPVFRLGGDRRGTAVKYIAPIPTSESQKLQLLAVTADGRRVYFSTSPNRRARGAVTNKTTGGRAARRACTYYYSSSLPASSYSPSRPGAPPASAAQRPQALVAVVARPALPQAPAAAAGRGAAAGLVNASMRSLDVLTVHYSPGALLLSEAASGDGRAAKLLLAGRNHALPAAAAVNTGLASGVPGLRELITELEQHIPGETAAIGSEPPASLLGPEAAGPGGRMTDELVSQIFTPPQRFVLISTAGVLELEKRRPADVLAALLAERDAGRLAQFFAAFGPGEAAAMCYMLAAAAPGEVAARVAEEALSALDNPALPEWSGAHRGLCVYLSRLLLPAWEVRAVTPSAADRNVYKCRLSVATMQVLESKLRALEAALASFMARRKSRGYSRAGAGAGRGPAGLFMGYLEDATGRMLNAAAAAAPATPGAPPPSGGAAPFSSPGLAADAGAASAPFAKRQRMWNAFVVEEQRNAAVRALAGRAAQALALLQALAGANVNRLAARLDDGSRRRLGEVTLRDLVLDPEGQRLAASLIAALVGEALDGGGGAGGGGGGVEELAGLLQARAPAFFREQDRRFYQATAKLKAAEEAAAPGERAALAAEAVAQLLRVPQVVPLQQMAPRLVFLRQWEGLVDLCLRAAALADPENAAWRPSGPAAPPPEAAAARAVRGRCYAHFLDPLRSLLGAGPLLAVAPAGAAKDGGATGAVEGVALSGAEAKAAKDAIFRAVTRSPDVYAAASLFSALADLGADADLLALDGGSPHLEGRGGVGPLAPRQVRHVELLARLHVARGRYSAAAQAYRALAERRGGRGAEAVSLQARLEAFQSALLQARSVGDDALVEGLRASCRVMEIQITTHARAAALLAAAGREAAAAGGDGEAREQAVRLKAGLSELEGSCLDISDLYNGHAQPHGMWDVCLEICHFAGHVPPEYVTQLWDLLLKAAWDVILGGPDATEAAAVAVGLEPCGGRGGSTAAALEVACDQATRLGSRFYPNEASFPLPHIALRLEQMGAGLWPEPGEAPPDDPARAVRALRAACAAAGGGGAACDAVRGAYESLLSARPPALAFGAGGGGGGGGGGDGGPDGGALRGALLRSLVALCDVTIDEELEAAPHGQAAARQAGALLDLAERCAHDARQLGGHEGLAAEFDRVSRRLGAFTR